MARSYQRKLQTTGYWIFVCNTATWSVDTLLRSGPLPSTYRISSYHRNDFGVGQAGVLRVNDDRRATRVLHGWPKLRKGIYALFEVTGVPEFRPDPDPGYTDPDDAAQPRWQVPVAVLMNLIDRPLLMGELPLHDDDFRYLHRPFQTSTIPLARKAFEAIVDLVGGIPEPEEFASLSPDDISAIRAFEERYASRAPAVTEFYSRRVERGAVGQWVKKQAGYHCQICSALGQNPIAFEDRSGIGFAEAHHVIPVSQRRAGSLSPQNIMVLCPNHHRQAHHGRFEIEEDELDHWQITLDGYSMRIDKPMLPPSQ